MNFQLFIMNKKNYLLVIAFLLIAQVSFAQGGTLDFTSPARKLLSALEKLFPYIAGIGALWVIFKNLNHFGEGEDVWKGLKNIGFYILIVFCLAASYKFIKSISL